MEISASVQITPKMLAEAFWGLDSERQAEFFSELKNAINNDYENGNSCAYSNGELQWVRLADDLEKNQNAKEMACALMASFFVRTTNYLSERVY